MRVSNSGSTLVMVAPNGARWGKDANPNMPLTSLEIVEETISCAKAGADVLHLHVRDASGKHTLDAGRYRETLQEIERALPGFPIQITTEAAGIFDVQQQVDCLREVRPEAVSISVREMARETKLASTAYGLCQ
ncbi:MAG: 3-keto-5-aminohexanoate cleavage protein, partial [Pseudomonadota bacterium]